MSEGGEGGGGAVGTAPVASGVESSVDSLVGAVDGVVGVGGSADSDPTTGLAPETGADTADLDPDRNPSAEPLDPAEIARQARRIQLLEIASDPSASPDSNATRSLLTILATGANQRGARDARLATSERADKMRRTGRGGEDRANTEQTLKYYSQLESANRRAFRSEIAKLRTHKEKGQSTPPPENQVLALDAESYFLRGDESKIMQEIALETDRTKRRILTAELSRVRKQRTIIERERSKIIDTHPGDYPDTIEDRVKTIAKSAELDFDDAELDLLESAPVETIIGKIQKLTSQEGGVDHLVVALRKNGVITTDSQEKDFRESFSVQPSNMTDKMKVWGIMAVIGLFMMAKTAHASVQQKPQQG